jgi:hypothetical protein
VGKHAAQRRSSHRAARHASTNLPEIDGNRLSFYQSGLFIAKVHFDRSRVSSSRRLDALSEAAQ